jgi:hypothetical protein
MENSINNTLAWFDMHPIATAVLLAWIMVWKGIALWKAAELHQKYWFIAVLVLNTLGVLEIFYIFFVANKYKVEVIEETRSS